MSTLLLTNLGVVCPSCESLNAPAASGCVRCKTALVDGPPPPSHPVSLAEAPPRSTSPYAGLGSAGHAVPGAPRPSLAEAPPPPSRTDSVPPGMRPMQRPSGSAPKPPPRAAAPVPASELVKKPAAPVAKPAAAPAGTVKFGLAVLAGPAKGQRFRLPATGAIVGRSRGVILFPEDPYLSAHHATLVVKDGRLFVRDERSTSGVFVSVGGQETIGPGGYFSTGQRLFRFAGGLKPAPSPAPGRMIAYGSPVPPGQVHYCVEEILVGGRTGRAVVTAGPILTIGQTKCDLSYPADEGLAPRHCELSPTPTGATIRDLSGGLGTFVRLTPGAERPVRAGDRLRLGQQIIQVEMG